MRRCGLLIPEALLLIACLAASCTSAQLAGESPSYVIIESLEAAAGPETVFKHSLQSDVLTSGRVLEDSGRAAFTLALKDPGPIDSPAQPGPVNFVTFSSYRVRFFRSDGRNQLGVDVPYPFDGALTVTVGASGAIATVVLVRAQAKLEAPLSRLRAQGGAVAISTIAEVTFFGRDQAGRGVSTAGQIGVSFGDWADAGEGAPDAAR
jgi:hypothetical protein